jgi:hypothetical protein
MSKKTTLLAAIVCCAVCSATFAEFVIWNEGRWPDSWPKELEPLRKQARTLDGPVPGLLHYQIPFAKREEFESAWPHLLRVKSKGAPIILMRSPYTRLGRIDAGVFIHTPLAGTVDPANLERCTYIELIVDGKIVDLNRIPLPADTPIIDERFKDEKKK